MKKRVEDKLNTSGASNFSDHEKEKLRQEAEIAEYGRMWVWENYFSEKRRDQWLQAAEKCRHINDQVLEDIEDWILLDGFKGIVSKKVHEEIVNDLNKRRVKARNKATAEKIKERSRGEEKKKE